MGSIRERRYRDGTHRFFFDYVDAAGVRRREVVHVDGPAVDRRRLVRRILAQKEAEAALGMRNVRPAETPRFAEQAADWLRRKQARVRDSTLVKYEAEIAHLKSYFGDMRVAAIRQRDVEDYLIDLQAHGRRRSRYGRPTPLARSTMKGILTRLKAVLKDARKLRVIAENPAVDVAPLPAGPPPDGAVIEKVRHLEPEQLERLVHQAEPPWADLWLLLGRTGLRRGEGLALKWSDLDLAAAQLHVRRQIRRARRKNGKGYEVRESVLKTRSSRRIVPLSPDVVDMLGRREVEQVITGAEEDGFVFRSQAGGPIDPDSVDRAFKRHLRAAGLPGFHCPHDLRHTAASHLLAAGVPMQTVQAILGHASFRTTADTYGHLLSSSLDGVGEQLAAFLRHAQGTKHEQTVRPAREPANVRD